MAAPFLSRATLLHDGGRLLAFHTTAWERVGGQWAPLAPLPLRAAAAYLDPDRGVVLVGFEQEALVRMTWGGEALDTVRLPYDVRTVDALAFDPLRRRLVICGGNGGLAPWTITLDERGQVLEHDVPLGSVVFDAARGRVIGLRTFELHERGVRLIPPEIGAVELGGFSPFHVVGARAYSALAWDEQRAAVIAFVQIERGEAAVLHVLNGGEWAPEQPPLEAPPRNLFRLVSTPAGLIAYGGQAFEGAKDSLWLLEQRAWREER